MAEITVDTAYLFIGVPFIRLPDVPRHNYEKIVINKINNSQADYSGWNGNIRNERFVDTEKLINALNLYYYFENIEMYDLGELN